MKVMLEASKDFLETVGIFWSWNSVGVIANELLLSIKDFRP